jgi:hypothetical protein
MTERFLLRKGHVYRTKDFTRWSANPARFAKRLVRQGRLVQLGQGLFVHPETSKFGFAPPSDEELMRGFLEESPFVFSGPEKWNALGLGSTAMFASPLVYNMKRSGQFTFGGRSFVLRRVKFPEHPTAEWFVVDLLENHRMAGVSLDVLAGGLSKALRDRRFNKVNLVEAAEDFGTKRTRDLVEAVLEERAA